MKKIAALIGGLILCGSFTLGHSAKADSAYNCTSNETAMGADFALTCTSAAIPPPPPPPSLILAAPTTGFVNGNYATGCSTSLGAASLVAPNHTCLTFDDHWDGANLNIVNWAPGLFFCNNGSGQNCGWFPGTATPPVNYPLSTWCTTLGAPGCFDSALFAYGYANVPAVSGIDTSSFKPLAKTPEGWLALGVRNYFQQTANNGTSGFCSGSSCQYLNWVGGTMTTGGAAVSPITSYPNSVSNTNAIIPAKGGLIQWRQKLDDGVLAGGYFGMQCAAVGGPYPGAGANDSNANMEFGYLPDARSIGNGLNDVAVQNGNGAGNTYVSTGDDGVGSGDTRNWHTYALEWTGTAGSSANQWHYYVDGKSLPVTNHSEPRVPTIGWNCNFSHNIASAGQSSFHSMWDTGWTRGGTFYAYLSDVQIYKKPGT